MDPIKDSGYCRAHGSSECKPCVDLSALMTASREVVAHGAWAKSIGNVKLAEAILELRTRLWQAEGR